MLVVAALYLLAGCGETAKTPEPPAPVPASAPVEKEKPGSGSGSARPKVPPESPKDVAAEGWGALVWEKGKAFRIGGEGTIAVGPGAVAAIALAIGEPPRCNAPAVTGAPHAAPILLPPSITKAPAPPADPGPVAAATIERVGWRLDEVLPVADKFTPNTPSTDPSMQRGVQVGTVIKVRRYGGPPWLVASGTRNCDAAFVVLDAQASRAYVADRIETCETLRVLNPTDLDGDGNLEVAAFNDDTVWLYRLRSEPGKPVLDRLGHWSCRP